MNKDLMFSSKRTDWETPQWLFNRLDRHFNFTLDVCATLENAKCNDFIGPDDDSLKQAWYGTCWMNPPYGREIGKWVKKAYESSRDARTTVVCLLPARTDTRWWHDCCTKGEITFIKGRLKFGGHENSAPFPSAIVVFRQSVRELLGCE